MLLTGCHSPNSHSGYLKCNALTGLLTKVKIQSIFWGEHFSGHKFHTMPLPNVAALTYRARIKYGFPDVTKDH